MRRNEIPYITYFSNNEETYAYKWKIICYSYDPNHHDISSNAIGKQIQYYRFNNSYSTITTY